VPRKTNADLAKLPKPLRIKARPIPRKHTGLAVDKEANRSDPRGAKYKTADSPLTRKQELFVKELVSNDGMITYKEAAIRAGYPESSAHTRAYELTNPTNARMLWQLSGGIETNWMNVLPSTTADTFETCRKSVTWPSKTGRTVPRYRPSIDGDRRRVIYTLARRRLDTAVSTTWIRRR